MNGELMPAIVLVLFSLIGILVLLRPRSTMMVRRHTTSSRNGQPRHWG